MASTATPLVRRMRWNPESVVEIAELLSPAGATNPFEVVVGKGRRLFPVSPARVQYLLADVLAGRGSEAAAITRISYRRAVAERGSEIARNCTAEFDGHAAAYLAYVRKDMALALLQGFLAVFMSGCYAAVFVSIAIYVREPPDTGFTRTTITAITVVSAAVIAASLGWSLTRLLSRRRNRATVLLEPTARVLDERLRREFLTVLADLIWETGERRLDPVLYSDRAPTLVEIESARVVPSETFRDVVDFLWLHVTSAVGVAGRIGAGKSTLLRWLAYSLGSEWVTVYVSTPATYDAADFARMIFRATASAVLADHEYPAPASFSKMVHWIRRKVRTRPVSEQIASFSKDALYLLSASKSDQWVTTGGFGARGMALQRQKQTTLTERELTHPELINAFTRYLAECRRLGGKKIVIAIDELDKLASTEEAIGVINSLKDLFHLPNTHFVVSVSEDALARFAMRGIPFRDVFDSAFDNVFRIEPPSLEDAWKLLTRRTARFPISAAMFCYAWSGGNPRDLIRTARACVDLRRRMGQPVSVHELAVPVVRKDIADTLGAAVTAAIERYDSHGVAPLLAVHRRITDQTVPLDSLPPTADLRDELGIAAAADGQAPMLERLALYIDVGRAVVQYFSGDVYNEIAVDYDHAANVVHKLAQARLALVTYPPEAQRLLSEAIGLARRRRTSWTLTHDLGSAGP